MGKYLKTLYTTVNRVQTKGVTDNSNAIERHVKHKLHMGISELCTTVNQAQAKGATNYGNNSQEICRMKVIWGNI